MKWIWIGIMIALFLSELVTLKFTSVWFIFSAILSLILYELKVDYIYQVLCFILVGVAFILIIRPLVIDKLVTKRDNIIKSILDKIPFFRHFISKDLLPVENAGFVKNNNQKKSNKK